MTGALFFLKVNHLYNNYYAGVDYCKHLCHRVSGLKISRIYENDILAQLYFGGHDIPWLNIMKKFGKNVCYLAHCSV